MTHRSINMLTATLITAALAGCAGGSEADRTDVDPPAAAPQEAPGGGVALRIELAARTLDRGGDVKEARAALEGASRDPAATPEERDQARLELSRALEIGGDRESAIAEVEALLGDHGDGRPWPMEARAEARLVQLLTGKASTPKAMPRAYARPLAPFARVLAGYFPLENRGGRIVADVSVVTLGGDDEDTRRIGAFDVARALREQRREACPLCEEEPSIQSLSSRSGSWVGIPRHRARLGSSVAVYYMTLGDGRIPARYDGDLPISSASIAAQLEQGKGVVAARERKGAPPSIVIAAPRQAQLGKMEEALAAMNSLPVEPFTMALTPHLLTEEIQAVVRAGFGQYRGCYEARLASAPGASGKITLKFAIAPSGAVTSSSVESVTGGLNDATLQQCMLSATNAFVFPEALEKTDVAYPIEMTPGDGTP